MASDTDKLSLKKELLGKRTIFSFALSMVLIYLFFSRAVLADVIAYAGGADYPYILLALAMHYLSYLFRGKRWRSMIQHTGLSGSGLDLAKITFLFQSVDCVLPAKLGDLYGAHLIKINYGLRRSFALGSIFLWRIIDFIFVVTAAMAIGYLLFGDRLPPDLVFTLKTAGPVLLGLVAVIGCFIRYHGRLNSLLKSERIRGLIDSFGKGLRIDLKGVPFLAVNTLIIWCLEGSRFYFVCKAMAVDISLLPVLFIMFFATLLTAVPFTPSGLGAVELGMLNLLALFHIGGDVAYSLIIWDRLIAHWSQILFGLIFVMFNRQSNLKVWDTEKESQPLSRKSPLWVSKPKT